MAFKIIIMERLLEKDQFLLVYHSTGICVHSLLTVISVVVVVPNFQ